MFPGRITRATEELIAASTTIAPKTDIIHVTDTTATTAIATIQPPFFGVASGVMFIVNRSGANISTITTGNIQTAVTIGQNVTVVAVYSQILGKYVIGALA